MKKNLKKRMAQVLALSLMLAMVVVFVPQISAPAYAESGDPALNMSTGVLAESVNTKDAQTVYYGRDAEGVAYPWLVIGYGDNNGSVVSTSGNMTLFAANNLVNCVFSPNDYNKYIESNLKQRIDAIAENLTSKEQQAVVRRTLASGSYAEEETDCISGDPVENALMWPLSSKEAYMVDKSIRMTSGNYMDYDNYWWLRSPGTNGHGYGDNSLAGRMSACVYNDGFIDYDGVVSGRATYLGEVINNYGVRPAFNLDYNKVLFTSSAEGGKSSGSSGEINAVSTNANDEWKLTLLDDAHNTFVIDSANITADSVAGTVTVPYSGAVTGNNEFISVIVKDRNDNITHYGRIRNCRTSEDVTGTVTINIPEGFSDGDTLYAFSEQCNGDKVTDYASALQEITTKLTITVKDQKCSYNGKQQGPAYTTYTESAEISRMVTISGLKERDTLDNVTIDGQGTEAGEYPLSISGYRIINGAGETANDNYFVSLVAGTLIIDPPKMISYNVTFKVRNGSWNDGTTADKKVTLSRYDYEDKALVLKEGDIPAAGSKPDDTYKAGSWDVTPSTSTAITQDTTYTYTYAEDPAPPTPKPTKISGTLLAKITAKGSNSLVLEWTKINGAEGYDIFFISCGKEAPKYVKTIKGGDTTTWTKTGLKKKSAYKARVKAWVMKDGKKTYVKTSPIVHAYTSGGTKNYTNSKSVTIKKTKVTLKKGKTYKIKASVKKLQKGKKLMPTSHAAKLRYLSTNTKVATVNKSGKITAKGKGTCTIYVYAVNGARKAVKVTVN